MSQAIILRRRRLGRTSTNGIVSASEKDIKVVRNWRARDRPAVAPRYVFRWGCTSYLDFPNTDSVVVNPADKISWCNDKKQSRLQLQAEGVPVPMTWDTGYFISHQFNRQGISRFVVRPRAHSQGRQLWYGDYDSCRNIILRQSIFDGYVSKLVDKVAEYRVFVCQGRAVWVAQKTPADPDAIAWNVNQGGRFDNVRWGEWKLPIVKAALHAAQVSGIDFCGVDVMEDGEGNPYVLELNSAPSQTSPYRQSCVAKAFDYIIDNGKEHFPFPERFEGWRDVIHPAIWRADE